MIKIKMRWVLVILGAYGMMVNYAIRANLSILIVSMVNHTAINQQTEDAKANKTSYCATKQKKEEHEDGRFIWDPEMQGYLMSSYFVGYALMQVPGGRMAEVFSAKWVFFFSGLVNIITIMLTPLAAQLHFYALVAIRFVQGLGAGPFFPTMHVLMANWAPLNERNTMGTIVNGGTALGTVASVCGSGYIAKYFGWEASFYAVGSVCSIWLVLWGIFISDNPQNNKFITVEEKESISKAGVQSKEGVKPKFPLIPILKSPPVWAICVAHICNNWGFYLLLTQTPIYFKFLGLSLTRNTLSSSTPYLLQFVFSIVLANLMDRLFKAKKIRVITIRKLCTAISCLVPSTCFLTLCYIDCNVVIAIVTTSIAIVAAGAHFVGYFANHVDIAPNFAGTLMGISNQLATLSGIIVPIFVGFVTKLDSSINAWRIIFFVTIGLYVLEFVVFTLFGRADVQSWNDVNEEAT